ncbi:MAG: antitoxin VbhA family protein [Betaproteobacteria bacterium]|nr:antitoxin VbhA family protein [Betaproteobacteria bacterium]
MHDTRSEAQRRWDMRQAIANCKIEGFDPDTRFLVRAERVVRGEITSEQAIEEIKAIVRDRTQRNR